MSSQTRAFYDEVEIWVDDVIQHTENIFPFNKSEEHSDPLNILGDQELNIPRPRRPSKRKRTMLDNGSPSKGLATRQSPRRKAPLDLASISLQPSEPSARGRSPIKQSLPKPSYTRRSPTKEQDQMSKDSSDHGSAIFQASLPNPSDGVSSSRSKKSKSQSPTHFKKTMGHLSLCTPPILLKTAEAFKKEMKGNLPPRVHHLAEALYFQAPDGFIPRALKVSKVPVARYAPWLQLTVSDLGTLHKLVKYPYKVKKAYTFPRVYRGEHHSETMGGLGGLQRSDTASICGRYSSIRQIE